MDVIIDGVVYVPRGEIPPLTDQRLHNALHHLTAIQYFGECTNKHRAWAWDALDALAPDLAQMPAKEAFDRIRNSSNS
jgi:hypothetical protein